jgi:hypothetical protein
MNTVVDWGARSRLLQSRLKSKIGDTSFWISPAKPPVALGLLKPNDVASWDMAGTAPIALAPDKTPLSVVGIVPSGPAHVRLDFELVATAGGATQTVLAFKQLFLVDSNGSLVPSQFSFEDYVLAPSPSGPTRNKGGSVNGRRVFMGLHPLVVVSPGRVEINAEFVDVTELWWAIRRDKLGWYLNPGLGGRQQHLRVLAWTGGGSPMLWFAVVPDAATKTLDPAPPTGDAKGAAPASGTAAAADLVFFRPPPGENSFPYSADRRGFLDPHHDEKTLFVLARYLLSPLPLATLTAMRGVNQPERLADQIQPTRFNPKHPVDPIDIASGFPTAFRPAGLEAALNRVGAPHVLFLPLGFDATPGYEAATKEGLKATIASALHVLWNNCAIARDAAGAPDLGHRQLWLVGHSAGNRSLWDCLLSNAADVGRVISFDATPRSDNLAPGINVIKRAAAARKRRQLTLDAFVITTPNMTNDNRWGLDDQTDRELRATGASVTVLPDFAERSSYWRLPPTTSTNPYLRYLLAQWTDAELAASAKRPHRWNFLFFHELAVFGGHHVMPPTTPPTLRTFFQDALGPPMPRPPLP